MVSIREILEGWHWFPHIVGFISIVLLITWLGVIIYSFINGYIGLLLYWIPIPVVLFSYNFFRAYFDSKNEKKMKKSEK